MGFKCLTLELAAHRGEKVRDNYVDAECEVLRLCSENKIPRYLLRYPDGVVLPVLWDMQAQGTTSRARELLRR